MRGTVARSTRIVYYYSQNNSVHGYDVATVSHFNVPAEKYPQQ